MTCLRPLVRPAKKKCQKSCASSALMPEAHSGRLVKQQQFQGGGHHKLVNKQSNHCLNPAGQEGKAGAAVAPCDGQPDQQWQMQAL